MIGHLIDRDSTTLQPDAFVLTRHLWPWDADAPTLTWSVASQQFAEDAERDSLFDEYIGAQWLDEIRYAFAAWSEVSGIRFVEVQDGPGVHIRIGFEDIDGPGGIAGWAPYYGGPDGYTSKVAVTFV